MRFLIGLALALSASTALAQPAPAPTAIGPRARTCLPEVYGARRDGVADDTSALQKALDACAGGGIVSLKSGVYLTGPIVMHSHETLEVAKDAVLQGVSDHSRYLVFGRPRPLIGASGERDVALVGEGVIDGAGQTWWPATRAAKAAGTPDPPRPRLILLSDVDGLVVRGLTLRNSPTFHLVPDHARHVLIEDLTITSPPDSPNTDGIDPSGRDMLIRNLRIDTGDDNIAIKSGRMDRAYPGQATGNIVIRDCVFLHGHGLSIGSETNGGVQHVLAENITFDGTITALRIKTARDRGGVVKDITYRNIKISNVRDAVLITAYYPKIPPSDVAQPSGPRTPDISDIRLENVTGSAGIGRLGGLYGLPERPIRGVVFDSVSLVADSPMEVRDAKLSILGARPTARKGEAFAVHERAKVTP